MSEILLIEDSPIQSLVYCRLLERAGHFVRHVVSADDAYLACRESNPDLVIVDQYLGEKSGLEVCRRLKSDPSLQVVPMIVLTGSPREQDHIAALDSGADRFLSKDNPPENLLATVESLLKTSVSVAVHGGDGSDGSDRDNLLAGIQLLIIDDSQTSLTHLRQLFTGNGFDVVTASTGEEGLQLLEQGVFHVVLIDMLMPGRDGFELCQAAREWSERQQTHIGLLMLSSLENRQNLIRALEAGADDFVNKQQDAEVIVAHVKSLARRVRVMRHVQTINRRSHRQELALREAEWKRQQAEERARHAESRATLYEELENVALELSRSKSELEIAMEAAEAASNAKSEFLANMSHEIRTPMNGVLGMLELLAKTPLTSTQTDYLELAQQSAQALLRLLDDILDFSKIEAGKLDLESVEFDLHDCIGSALRMMSIRAHQKRLELACRIAPEIPGRLIGDPGRLRQVLLNLVNNAIKFTEQGEIDVNVELESDAEDQLEIRFSVRDTGIGIPREQQSRVFEVFAQADTSTTRRFGGTGLGLAISSRLASMMGGKIWMESEFGAGTTCSFTIRLGKVPHQPESPPGPPPLEGLSVLVVSSREFKKSVLQEQLGCWGARTSLASKEQDAAELSRQAHSQQRPFDLILIDVRTDNNDHAALMPLLSELQAMRSVPIIVLCSQLFQTQVDSLQPHGQLHFLFKPVMRSELLSAIQRVLSGERADQHVTRLDIFSKVSPRKILLAEDSCINQRVALEFLKRWGHEVFVVDNGRDAVKVIQDQRFDLVLMDLQMPEMGGIAATAHIRQLPAPKCDVPVIAMTAEAMKGDREKCLAAGMNDYLSKPIRSDELFRMIARWTGAEVESMSSTCGADYSDSTSTDQAEDADQSIDWAHVFQMMDNDRALVEDLAVMLREQGPILLSAVEEAMEVGDSEKVRRTAHALKGSVGYFGAPSLIQVTNQLEKFGLNDHEQSGPELLNTLRSQMDVLMNQLDRLAVQ